ncbi:MAG: biotin carboxylase, partial [Acidobacteriota bacterium]|nr:biotin carboxylase [Acidobacteriota bacterium]
AARPVGGLCARALAFVPTEQAGQRDGRRSLEALLLLHALGEPTHGWTRESVAAGVMMIPVPRAGIFRDVGGVDAARAVPGVEDVVMTAKAGQTLVPLPEGASYLGFIFARADEPGQVEAALRNAHAALHFDVAPSLPIVS